MHHNWHRSSWEFVPGPKFHTCSHSGLCLDPLPVSTMKSYTWVLAYDLSPPAPGIRKLEVQVSEAVLGLLLPSWKLLCNSQSMNPTAKSFRLMFNVNRCIDPLTWGCNPNSWPQSLLWYIEIISFKRKSKHHTWDMGWFTNTQPVVGLICK